MKTVVVAWLAALVGCLLLDGLWLGVLARGFYVSRLGERLRQPILVAPAAAFYVGYAAGLVFLAVRPLEPALPLSSVALHGAAVGFVAYGTYAMTNLATLRDWPAALGALDLLWGTALSATVAVIAAVAAQHVT